MSANGESLQACHESSLRRSECTWRTTHKGFTGGRKQCLANKPIPVIVTSGRTALPTSTIRKNLALTVRKCGIGIDIRNVVCVQTNIWYLPTLVNTNVRGALAGKLDDIKVIKDNYFVDIIAITETWCTSSIPDGPVSLSGCNIYRRNRQDGRQLGCIACYVRDSFPTEHWPELNQPDIESLWISICPPKMSRDHPQSELYTILRGLTIG